MVYINIYPKIETNFSYNHPFFHLSQKFKIFDDSLASAKILIINIAILAVIKNKV